MTPQSTFMIVADIADGREAALVALLERMNASPGVVDPHGALFPFARFDRLHVARFVILGSNLLRDNLSTMPVPRPRLLFLGDCDGPADSFLAQMAVLAGPQLQAIFSHCDGFADAQRGLVGWMQARDVAPAANYINWIGRTVLQVREEEALHDALSGQLARIVSDIGRDNPRAIRQQLLNFVEREKDAGRLTLTAPAPTPTMWWIRNQLHKFGVPLILLALSPVLLLLSPYFLFRLRSLERTDPESVERPALARMREMAAREDHDITNPFSAFGEVKPQAFRRHAVRFFLLLLGYAAQHVYNRGYLTRVQTIHFARWVLLDGNRSLFFASNYDGSLESYMDDFINKVGWGLNLVFSNGAGYPSTRWLVKDGAGQEQKFKYFLKRRQVPTQVWYKAYPGRTAFDLARNARVREGVETRQDDDEGIRQWLAQIQV